MRNIQRQTRKQRLHSKCFANCPAWRTVLAHVVYQLFRCCWPVGRQAKHLFNHWVINSVSRAVTQAVRFIDSFMHSVCWLVSRLNSADTDTDVWMLGGLGPAHGPPGAACCQLTAWCFYQSPVRPGRATFERPYSFFGGGGITKKSRLRCIWQRLFVLHMCLGFMGPYWVLLVWAFVMLISRVPSNSLCGLRASETGKLRQKTSALS